MSTEDLIDSLSEEALVSFITQGGKQEKLAKGINMATIDHGNSIRAICKGQRTLISE